jgi:hypothetical protein
LLASFARYFCFGGDGGSCIIGPTSCSWDLHGRDAELK